MSFGSIVKFGKTNWSNFVSYFVPLCLGTLIIINIYIIIYIIIKEHISIVEIRLPYLMMSIMILAKVSQSKVLESVRKHLESFKYEIRGFVVV